MKLTTSVRRRWNGFWQEHPILLWAIVLIVAFIAGPIMMAGGRMTAVLYKDF
jgi:hypothetical protein